MHIAHQRDDRPARFGSQRRGAAAVEFAVLAPVLFALILGAIEIGRLVMISQTVENAAAIGSREAAKATIDSASVASDRVNQYLESAGVPSSAVTVDIQPNGLSSLTTGAEITVTAQVDFAQISWLPPLLLPSDARVQAISVMARE